VRRCARGDREDVHPRASRIVWQGRFLPAHRCRYWAGFPRRNNWRRNTMIGRVCSTE
jgi:hypothetical protein